MPFALCPVPYALYPVPYALCPVPYTLCPMPLALCPVPYVNANVGIDDVYDPQDKRFEIAPVAPPPVTAPVAAAQPDPRAINPKMVWYGMVYGMVWYWLHLDDKHVLRRCIHRKRFSSTI